MQNPAQDTIAAISTPQGEGGIAVLRVSGMNALPIVQTLFESTEKTQPFPERRAVHGLVSGKNGVLDEVIVLYFKAPGSYTGEDVVEISCHGSPYVARSILSSLSEAGARPAGPGEFTLRAFLNGKMDLAQAEAVADLIRSKTDASRKSALAQLSGSISRTIEDLRKELVSFCSLLEIELDFAEEDIQLADRGEMENTIATTMGNMDGLIRSFDRGRIWREGFRIAIAGKPNVGKSSLLNRLLEKERAIVTDIPGTTRDTVEDILDVAGVLTFITDTAGIRDTEDPIEKHGVARSEAAARAADMVLLVLDRSVPLDSSDYRLIAMLENFGKTVVYVANKADMPNAWRTGEAAGDNPLPKGSRVFELSAKTGQGIGALASFLEDTVSSGILQDRGEAVLTNERHRDCLIKARDSLARAAESMNLGLSQEFIALDMRGALESLGEITGKNATDEVLTHVFSNFCIGK